MVETLLATCEQWMIATRKNSKEANESLQHQGRQMYRRVICALDTGLRASEMLGVQLKEIDFKTWRVTIPWQKSKGGKTTGKDEFVWAMTPRLQTILEARKFIGPNGYVFGTDEGAKVKKFDNLWRKLFRAAEMPPHLVWHDLRHEFVSSLIERGGSVQEVKEAARHKSITTTEKYMKADEQRVKALMARLAG
jgi:integrase